jgi:HK97 family phage portal protein
VTLLRAARDTVRELRAGPEDPNYPLTSATLVELFAGSRTSSGVYVSEHTAHRIIAVYRAWSLLAGTIGSLPLQAFNGPPPGGVPWAGDQAGLLSYPGGRDEITGIATPGSPPAMVFWETAVLHLLTWGNAYLVRIPNLARTRTVALDLLQPCNVAPRWARRTADNPYGKEFVVFDENGVTTATPRDVIHIRAMGSSLLQGISPIGAARQALGLAVAAEEYGARLFGSGSLMAGVLQTDQRLDEDHAKALKARWRQKMAGLAHAHEIAVLDSGAKFQPVSFPPEDSQFIESRKFQVVEIARLYGIPPHMLGDVERSTSWGTGIAEQGIGFNVYTLRPWLARIEQTLSNELLPRGVNCRFDVSELLRGDAKSELEAHQVAVLSGQETPNEARAARGMPPLPGGDELLFPLNYGSLSNVANPPTPAALPAAPSPAEVP